MTSKLGDITLMFLFQIAHMAFSNFQFVRQLSNSLALDFLPEFSPPHISFSGHISCLGEWR